MQVTQSPAWQLSCWQKCCQPQAVSNRNPMLWMGRIVLSFWKMHWEFWSRKMRKKERNKREKLQEQVTKNLKIEILWLHFNRKDDFHMISMSRTSSFQCYTNHSVNFFANCEIFILVNVKASSLIYWEAPHINGDLSLHGWPSLCFTNMREESFFCYDCEDYKQEKDKVANISSIMHIKIKVALSVVKQGC